MIRSDGSRRQAPSDAYDHGSADVDDLTLIVGVADGDEQAFETLYRRYQPRLFRYLRRLLRVDEGIEDIVNEVMFVVWQRAESYEGRSRPSTWILGIAYNKALNRLRRLSRDPATPLSDAIEDLGDREEYDPIARRQLWIELESAMGSLSAEQRAAVELTFFYGFSYREIAKISGVPENTVKTRMFYARQRLREAWPSSATGGGPSGGGPTHE